MYLHQKDMLLGTQHQLQSSSHRKAATETKITLEQNLPYSS